MTCPQCNGSGVWYSDDGQTSEVCPACSDYRAMLKTMTDSDLTIGYRAGQEDSAALKALAEIVRLDDVAKETTEYEDFVAVSEAIQAARELLAKRKQSTPSR